ncbi:hypothetical protein F5884DRAFT_896975 [Xylogone sp. PMI_703]|nr:hypothetical protein F5884DRAFT_896975 [Xylogone sp. PMI_703]
MAEKTLSSLVNAGILKLVDKGHSLAQASPAGSQASAVLSRLLPNPTSGKSPEVSSDHLPAQPPLTKPILGSDPTEGHGNLQLLPPVDITPFPVDGPPLQLYPTPPKVAYSPVLKAFASALRPFVTLDEDLSASGKAFFIGSPLQYGIPTSLDEQEYLNEALFTMCDPIQTLNSPVFSAAGVSYFEWLRAYVRNVQDTSEADPARVAKATTAYQEAARHADEEFHRALSNFKDAVVVDSKLSFIDWMSGPFGKDYRNACDNRDIKNDILKKIQGTGLTDVARSRELLDSARARLESKQGNNMPVALRDIVPAGSGKPPGTGVAFLPLYYLSGYATASNTWIMNSGSLPSQSLPFSPVPVETKTWTHLGFSHIVDEVASESVSWIKDVKIVLKFNGMGAFDVRRGLWDINGVKTVLPPLKPTAVDTLKNPILKTVKVLIAYGVELIVHLPPKVVEDIRAETSSSTLVILPELLGNLPATWNSDNTALIASLDAHNAYPVLLGVLSQVSNVDE